MGANEIANHIEAACWLKFGPAPGEDPAVPTPLYFRSQNGFINQIGVADVSDPMAAPIIFVQLDRYYSRRETSINVFLPLVLDVVEIPPAAPTLVGYPTEVNILQPAAQPTDSRLVYGEITMPTDPVELAAFLDRFNGFMVFPRAVGGEGAVAIYGDICIQVFRVPKGENQNVTYREIVTP